MPKITEYRESVRVPDARGRIPREDGRVAGGREDGVGMLAKGATQALTALQARQEEDARAWSTSQLAGARLYWTEQLTERQMQYKPGPNAEFTPKVLQDYDEWTGKLISTAPNETSQRYLQTRLAELRSDVGQKAVVFEAQAGIDWRADQHMLGAHALARLMNSDPSQYKPALAEWLATLETTNMPPIKKSEIREKGVTLVSKGAVMSQIQRSPAKFLESIGFGLGTDARTRPSSGELMGTTGNTAFDALPFESRMQAFEQAIRAKAQVDIDSERITTARRKELAGTASKNLWESFFKGNLKLEAVIAHKDVLDDNDFKSLGEAAVRGPRTQHDNPITVSELSTLVYSNPQEAITLAHRAVRDGRITPGTFRSELERAQARISRTQPETAYERDRRWLLDSLNPGEQNFDMAKRARQTDAVRMFDDWRNTNPGAKDADIRNRANEIYDQFVFVDLRETSLQLPVPRSTNIRRTQNPELLEQDIARAALAIKSKKDNKEWSQSEYEQEMATLNRWRRLMERAREASKK